jgi:hypothetical protein
MKNNKEIWAYILVLISIGFIQGCISIPNNERNTISNTIINTITITKKPTIILSQMEKPTRTLTEMSILYTPLPTIDLSNMPPSFQGTDSGLPFSKSDVVYLFNVLKMSFTNHDPLPLLDFLIFPLNESNRCPGDIIETQEEFIERFPEITSRVTADVITKMKPENAIIRQREFLGFNIVSPYDVWFTFYCSSTECGGKDTHHIIIHRFLDYSPYYDVIKGFPTAIPTYDPSLINYGVYKVTSNYHNIITQFGELASLDEESSLWNNFTIKYTKTSVSMGPFVSFRDNSLSYRSCNYKAIEVCEWEDEAQFSSGGRSRGQLLLICNNSRTDWIMIMDNHQLGYQFKSKTQMGYLILDIVENI